MATVITAQLDRPDQGQIERLARKLSAALPDCIPGHPVRSYETAEGVEVVIETMNRTTTPFIVRGPMMGVPIARFGSAKDAVWYADNYRRIVREVEGIEP